MGCGGGRDELRPAPSQDPWPRSRRRTPLPLSGSAEPIGSATPVPRGLSTAGRVVSRSSLVRPEIVVPLAYRAGMFPPEVFGVGVTVAELSPVRWDDVALPAGVVSRPSRIGDLLPVELMTPEQK